MPSLYVFGLLMMLWVVGEIDSRLVVNKEINRFSVHDAEFLTKIGEVNGFLGGSEAAIRATRDEASGGACSVGACAKAAG